MIIERLKKGILWSKFQIVSGLDTSKRQAHILDVLSKTLPLVQKLRHLDGAETILNKIDAADAASIEQGAVQMAQGITEEDSSHMRNQYMKLIRVIETAQAEVKDAAPERIYELLAQYTGAELPTNLPVGMIRHALTVVLRNRHSLYGEVLILLLKRESENDKRDDNKRKELHRVYGHTW